MSFSAGASSDNSQRMTELNWDVWKSADCVQVDSDDYVAFDSHLPKYFQLLMDFDFG